MAYDEDLAERVRRALADEANVRETKMFGGLGFMVNDKMVACVRVGGGALLVRVGSERDDEYLQYEGADRAEMGKEHRSMGAGWIAVDAEALAGDGIQFWIDAVLELNAASA